MFLTGQEEIELVVKIIRDIIRFIEENMVFLVVCFLYVVFFLYVQFKVFKFIFRVCLYIYFKDKKLIDIEVIIEVELQNCCIVFYYYIFVILIFLILILLIVQGCRKVIVVINIVEILVIIQGIKFVIDLGVVKVK